MGLFTPRRRMGHEVLDEPGVSDVLVARSHTDIARANALFGGTRAVVSRVRALAARLPDAPLVVDVGAGTGDILDAACSALRMGGRRPRPIAIDTAIALAPAVRQRGSYFICGSIFALPLATASVDLVIASQVVHHFSPELLPAVLAELNRVARHAVLVSDLQRSWLAAAGLWLTSFPLGFHPVSRHDGVVSVLRGFAPDELRRDVERATGAVADVRTHLGWRVTADWRPGHAA
ncbi:MAG TPA: methyltransferase domain-containing protein [Gemmatimonadaceae bacterium]|nr:methyltransferase domain-containing protein [Gemmatimonadaceae bacterium]